MASTGQQVGRLLLVKIGDGGSPETFSALCGITSTTFTLSANDIDTTIPDCADPSATPQKTGTPGIKQRQFQGSGKFVAGANSSAFIQHVIDATSFNAEVVVPGLGSFQGPWYVTNFDFSGKIEGNMDFTATFMAGGPLTFTAEV